MTSEPMLDDPCTVERYLHAMQAAGELPRVGDQHGALLLLLTGARHEARGALAVDNVPTALPQPARVRTLGPLLRRVRSGDDAAGAVLVHVRVGTAEPLGGDLAWRGAFSGTCGVAGLTDLGTYVCTPSGVLAVPPDLTAA